MAPQEAALEVGRNFEQERAAREQAEIRLLHAQSDLANAERQAAGEAAMADMDSLRRINVSLHEEITHLNESVIELRALVEHTASALADIQIVDLDDSGDESEGHWGRQGSHSAHSGSSAPDIDDRFYALSSNRPLKDEVTFTFTLHSFWQLADDAISHDRIHVVRRWIALSNSALSSYMPYIRMWRVRAAALTARSLEAKPAAASCAAAQLAGDGAFSCARGEAADDSGAPACAPALTGGGARKLESSDDPSGTVAGDGRAVRLEENGRWLNPFAKVLGAAHDLHMCLWAHLCE
jgi:hypothetical protein